MKFGNAVKENDVGNFQYISVIEIVLDGLLCEESKVYINSPLKTKRNSDNYRMER